MFRDKAGVLSKGLIAGNNEIVKVAADTNDMRRTTGGMCGGVRGVGFRKVRCEASVKVGFYRRVSFWM